MKTLLAIKVLLILVLTGTEPIFPSVFGSLTLDQVLGFFFWSNFGMLFTLFLHYRVGRWQKRKRSNYAKFSLKYWFSDSWARIITNEMGVLIVLVFFKRFYPDIELDLFYGLAVGMSIDLVIIMIRKFTGINIFQKQNP